ncbi:oligosaccharyl transferase subunit ost3/OST6 [Thoreauomyces humboldtii]|nr:oligosaccharyl transferase subunit ost3/OST6 [Thoreauomyces humboldtii]
MLNARFFALLLLVLSVASVHCRSATSAKKIDQLNSLLAKDTAIRLAAGDFDYVTAGPRNYSLIVSLTALAPEMGCVPCRAFEQEFNLVAYSWQRKNIRNKLYFAQLEFNDGREVFQKLKVQSVPMILHFPPTEASNADFEVYDLNRWGLTGNALVKFVNQAAHVNFAVRRPIDWNHYGLVGASGLGFLVALRLTWKYVVAVLQSRKLWSTALIGWSVLMCSGHMWNTIRTPPYTGMKNDKPEIVAPGFQNQFVLETQLVGILCKAPPFCSRFGSVSL